LADRSPSEIAFLATAAASILLIAPSAHHRLRWREGDKERILRMANDLAIAGTVFLALGMTAAVFLSPTSSSGPGGRR
jgi:Family of unknown function (DUF6328)